MKEFWLEKDKCSGCAACMSVCPKSSITMKSDEYGFIYPHIGEQCIDCNLCQVVCEKRHKLCIERYHCPKTYATWSKDSNVRFKSTSGGAFTELAKGLLEEQGIVAGAMYNSDNLVEHTIVDNVDDLEKIRQSKYTQSSIGVVFKSIKKNLLRGKVVGFCGTPCQVAGLYAYLGRDYDNLYTIDFICRGINSPKAYKSWLSEIEEKEKSKVTKVWFKYKQGGWKASPKCTRLDFENGKNIVLDQENNLYMVGYLGPNLYIRPSCGECEFKGVPRQGDITLADFWGVDEEVDDDNGTSMLLINSDKGNALFSKVKINLNFYERDFKEIFDGNVCFGNSVEISPESKKFLIELDNVKFSEAIKKYTKTSYIKKIGRKAKWILKKILVR